MDSVYGNEWKDRHEDMLSEEQIRLLTGIWESPPPLVLNLAHWHCEKNWQVPSRRIIDNLLLIVRSGRIHAEWNGERRILHAGECLMIPENTLHRYGIAEGEEECSNYVLHLLSLVQRPEQMFSRFASPLRKLHHPAAVFEQLDLAIALRNSMRAYAESFAAQLIRILEREAVLDGEYRNLENRTGDSRVERILSFIQRNYTSDIGIADIADDVHLKEVQFRRIFQKETGMTPVNYLHRQRLLHAVRLLLRSSAGLTEIAADSGFHSVSYFCRAFRKFYRMTPDEFRRSFR